MNEIERKALAWINQVAVERGGNPVDSFDFELDVIGLALIRAIEQHEAFRQEVSDAVEGTLHSVSHWQGCDVEKFRAALSRFIIAKPDPLEEAVEDWINNREFGEGAASLRAAIEKRGGKIIFNEEQK